MTIKELQAKTNEELLASLYWIGIRICNESNSKRGATKGSVKAQQAIIKELASRFNINGDSLTELTNR